MARRVECRLPLRLAGDNDGSADHALMARKRGRHTPRVLQVIAERFLDRDLNRDFLKPA